MVSHCSSFLTRIFIREELIHENRYFSAKMIDDCCRKNTDLV